MSVGHIQLPIDKHRHARLDSAGTLSVRRNQPIDRCIDEHPFGAAEEDGHVFRLLTGSHGLPRCDALGDGNGGGRSHFQKIPPVKARSRTHPAVPPELHDRAVPRRLSRSGGGSNDREVTTTLWPSPQRGNGAVQILHFIQAPHWGDWEGWLTCAEFLGHV